MPERTALPTEIPEDKEYGARGVNDSEARARDAAAAAAASDGKDLHAPNADKLAYGSAQAQYLANYFNCAVKAHFHALPHCQHNGPTMDVDFVPADREADIASAPEPGV